MKGHRISPEELANVATHGFGLVASLAALPLFILLAMRDGDAWTVTGASVFGATLVGVYAASTIYHCTPAGPRREHWCRLDQAAVYLLIAGTYTPFTLGVLRGSMGRLLFAVIWCAAAIGVALRLRLRARRPWLENATYLTMGWLALLVIGPLLEHIGWTGVAWLVAGGVTYSLGVIFLCSRIRFGH